MRTRTFVTVVLEGDPIVITDPEGSRVHPSLVHFEDVVAVNHDECVRLSEDGRYEAKDRDDPSQAVPPGRGGGRAVRHAT